MLQTLTIERGPAGGTTQQEAAGLHVAGGPGQVAHTLEAEHRVVREERQHDDVAGGIRRGRRDPGAEGTGLVDPFLQDLATGVFLVVHDLVLVDRHVFLSFGGIDAQLAEHAFHAEGTGLVGHDRHDTGAEGLVTQQQREEAHEGLRGGDLAPFDGRIQHGLEGRERRNGQLFVGLAAAVRQEATQGLAALEQVLHLGGVFGRAVERDVLDLVVRDGNLEAVTHAAHAVHVQLLELVGGVLALAGTAHAIALDGLGQDDGGTAFVVVDGGMEGGIDLVRIVAATVQAPDVFVGHARDHFEQLGVLAEEVLAHVGTVVGLAGLVFAVDGLHHDAAQGAVGIARQQRIPVRAPDELDDVPATAAEVTFQFLDDLAVAAHRAIQTLQVAVDDEDEVVELFAGGQTDGTQRFGFVHLAVAAEDPDLAVGGVCQATGMQVLEEACLVDGHQRPQTHRHGGELPEVRHQLGVRIGRQALAVDFLAEVVELLFGQAAFEEGTTVDAGRGVTLEVDQVAAVAFVRGMPEVVHAGADHGGQRGKRGDVTAEAAAIGGVMLVGLDDHGHGVPADEAADALLQLVVARRRHFECRWNGVHIGRGSREGHVAHLAPCLVEQLLQQVMCALGAFALDDGLQGVEPLAGLDRVGVGGFDAVGCAVLCF